MFRSRSAWVWLLTDLIGCGCRVAVLGSVLMIRSGSSVGSVFISSVGVICSVSVTGILDSTSWFVVVSGMIWAEDWVSVSWASVADGMETSDVPISLVGTYRLGWPSG